MTWGLEELVLEVQQLITTLWHCHCSHELETEQDHLGNDNPRADHARYYRFYYHSFRQDRVIFTGNFSIGFYFDASQEKERVTNVGDDELNVEDKDTADVLAVYDLIKGGDLQTPGEI